MNLPGQQIVCLVICELGGQSSPAGF